MPGSTDVGDVSYVVPTAQMGTAGMAIGTPGHTWQITGQTCSSIGKKALLKASEALALAAARVLDDPCLLYTSTSSRGSPSPCKSRGLPRPQARFPTAGMSPVMGNTTPAIAGTTTACLLYTSRCV